MIKGLHYFGITLFILGQVYPNFIFHHLSAGIFLGIGIGYWGQWKEQNE